MAWSYKPYASLTESQLTAVEELIKKQYTPVSCLSHYELKRGIFEWECYVNENPNARGVLRLRLLRRELLLQTVREAAGVANPDVRTNTR